MVVVHRNRLNNEQTIKINMLDEVDTNLVSNSLLYGGNLIIGGKITSFHAKMSELHTSITKKIHDASGERPAKEVMKEDLAKFVSRKGKSGSVYFKSISDLTSETLLDKEWSVIYKMKDVDCISFCNEVRGILHSKILVLGPYGYDSTVEAAMDLLISHFSTEKPLPVSDQVSKNVGNEAVDAKIVEIMNIIVDLDKMLPDAFGDTHADEIRDYVMKRVEHTVGNRHNIVQVSVKRNPGAVAAHGAIFIVKDNLGVVVKELVMSLSGTNLIGSIRSREYSYEVSCTGCVSESGTFRVAYRDTLELDFVLEAV